MRGDPGGSAMHTIFIAGFASLAAGAVHAAAIGTHAEHRSAVWTFTVLAALQLGWGALALARRGRIVALAGALVNGAAVAGWIVAKTSGIGFVDGLDHSEPIQRADGIAAALGAVAVVLALRALAGTYLRRSSTVGPRFTMASAVLAVALASTGMVSAGAHQHVGGDDGHDHGGDGGEVHQAAVVPPKPYHPDLPIDLGGVEGVTPQQQAKAENLVAMTVERLPQWADPAYAESKGFRSIGDGFTGHEHYMNSEFMLDDEILNPDKPESLVYDTSVTPKKLVSAMYMLRPGQTLDEVPELGGKLTQWHVHDDLCFTPTGRVAGTRQAGGPCPDGLVPAGETPMIHVWITPHRCGPFAALEGVAAGAIAEGEERLCDHAHGSS